MAAPSFLFSEITEDFKGQQVSSVIEISPHDPKIVDLNLERACDRFPELIISIPSDTSHLHLVKPVSHAS